jgi:O-antigen biosynthesis protein
MNGTVRTVEARIVEADIALARDPDRRTAFAVLFPLIDYFSLTSPATAQTEFASMMEHLGTTPSVTPALMPKVSAIVLNWNGAHLLGPLLGSIEQRLSSVDLEIILVDHGSSDDSIAVAERYKHSLDLTIIPRGENFSFSNSNNLAARRASGEFLLVLNNDIVFTHDCVSPLTAALAADSSLGIISMRLLEPVRGKDGWQFASHHCGIKFAPRVLQDGAPPAYLPVEVAESAGDVALTLSAPAVTAAACMCRKVDFLAVGGFDEAYFYGLEDVDLCQRMARGLGKRIACDTRLAPSTIAAQPAAAAPASRQIPWRLIREVKPIIAQFSHADLV